MKKLQPLYPDPPVNPEKGSPAETLQPNLKRALNIPREALRFDGDNPFSYDEDFVTEKKP